MKSRQITLIPGERLYIEPVAFDQFREKNKLHFFENGSPDVFIPWDIGSDGTEGQIRNHFTIGLIRHLVAIKRLCGADFRYKSISNEYATAVPYFAADVPNLRFSLRGNLYPDIENEDIESKYVNWNSSFLIKQIMESDEASGDWSDMVIDQPVIIHKGDKKLFIDWMEKCKQNKWDIYFLQHIDT